MDDKNFDSQTAADWITAVESHKKTLRDEDIYPRLNAWLNAHHPKTVIDLGCGQGICSTKLKGFQNYIGVDPSPDLISRAKSLYTNAQNQFIEGNAYKLPLADNKAQAVFSVLVFHLLEQLETAIAELARVLEKGGVFNIITANAIALENWAALYDDCKIEGKKLSGTMTLAGAPSADVLYFHTIANFEAAFSQYGLKLEGTSQFRQAPSGNGFMLIEIKGVKE